MQDGFLEKTFKLKQHNTTVSTEVLAGFTTFMTMAYILAVNPGILSATGMNFGSVFTATALSAVLATMVMGLYANMPFALAPGMGLNAFFAFFQYPGGNPQLYPFKPEIFHLGRNWSFYRLYRAL